MKYIFSKLVALAGICYISLNISMAEADLAEVDPVDTDLAVISAQSFSTLDPHVGYDWLSYVTLNTVCATLTVMTENLDIINDLALDIEYVNDGYSIIFHLDPNRKFHNGKYVRAKDVAYSFNRMMNPKTQSPGASLFDAIAGYEEYREGKASSLSGITVLDDLSVRFDLIRKSYSLPYIFATNFGCIIPEGYDQKQFDLPISAGFLKAEKYTEDGKLYLSRFDIDPPVYVFKYETMTVHANLGENDVLDLFARGAADLIIDGLAWTIIKTKYSVSKEETNPEPAQALTYIALNTQLPPFDDVNVRRAVNYAINREELAGILKQAATPTSQIVPPAFPEYDSSIPDNIYDPKRAIELLKGYSKPIVANIYTVDNPLFNELVYSIAKDLREVGIVLVPKYGNHERVMQVGSDPTQGQMIFSDGLGWHPDYFHISNFYFPLLAPDAIGGTGWNWPAYNNPEVHEMAQRAETLIGPEHKTEREELWKRIFARVQDDAVMIPLYNRKQMLFGFKIKDGVVHPIGYVLKTYVNK